VAGDDLDPQNPEFIRADGSHVIVEDRHFGSAGTAAYPGLGGQEIFGDASAVAAQGNRAYDLSSYGFPQHPIPASCTVKVRGMAPDASLYVDDFTFTSEAIAAIDHLVRDDHVDVINEAFWFELVPDDPSTDPFMIANGAAVRAGGTVVAASGDAGIDSSQTTPGADPSLITVGATTAGRFYRQLQIAAFQYGDGRAEDNQPSSFSEDGYSSGTPRIIDLVAPGDGGWNACTPAPEYPACVTMSGAPSPVRAFRGTSESAPLVAGEAALVIQRYRDTHGGSSPTPQLVKSILMSSAHDLRLPARIQGAGLIDSLAAVRLAGRAGGLVADGSGEAVTAAPGDLAHRSVPVTNTSAQAVTVRPVRQDFRTIAADTSHLTLDPYDDPHFFCAGPSAGITRTFNVPAGADRLTVEAAGAIDPGVGPQQAAVNVTLIDPSGRWANWNSSALPSAPFAHVEEGHPAPGTWTAVIWTGQDENGWHGDVTFHWQAQQMHSVPAGTPIRLGTGATAPLPIQLSMPDRPGDSDTRIQLRSSDGSAVVVPVAMRTTVPIRDGRGSFGGTFTGIVGRTANGSTQVLTYALPVTSPQSLEIDLHLSSLTMVHAYLVDPAHDLVAERTNCIDPDGHQLIKDLTMYVDRPARGTWLLALELDRAHGVASGYDDPFTAEVRTSSIGVTTHGLPDSSSDTIPAGSTRTATISVANTGDQQQAFFTDARLDHSVDLPLAQLGAGAVALPTTDDSSLPIWLVPPLTTRLTVTGDARVPFDFDLYPEFGDPDVTSVVGVHPVAEVERPELPASLWSLTGDLAEPSPAGVSATFAASVRTAAFDDDLRSSTGDAWLAGVDPAAPSVTPVVVPAGDTGSITVSITSHGPAGTVVSGTLYVDMSDCVAGVGDKVIALPYRYTVG